jgi:hypothetical protein
LNAIVLESQSRQTAEPSQTAKHLALLNIQAAQMLYIKQSMEQEINQTADCIDRILHLSSSDLVMMASGSLEQNRKLAEILERVATLESESEADHAEIQHLLMGLEGISQLVSTHLAILRNAREQMHLLNLNSMIAADRLGGQAAGLVEIARNINRISSDWEALAARTEMTMARVTLALQSANRADPIVSSTENDTLASGLKMTRERIAALKDAAAMAARNSGRVDLAVTRLKNEIDEVSVATEGARQSLNLIERAIGFLSQAQRTKTSDDLPGLTDADLHQIEARCEASYTTELERQILRAALHGQAVPLPGEQAAIGNDVELF